MDYMMRETVYVQGFTSPIGYYRWDIGKYSGMMMELIECQISAELIGLTNFNDIKDEKYIEL